MTIKNHISLTTDATGTEVSSAINAKSITWLSNDGANDITFNFEEGVTASGNWVLRAGEVVNDINIPVTTLYYIATAGSTNFSLFGIAK